MERIHRIWPGSAQPLTRCGQGSHLGPPLYPGRDGWGKGIMLGGRGRGKLGVVSAGKGAEPKKHLALGYNLLAFPAAEVRGFLLEADEQLLACLYS